MSKSQVSLVVGALLFSLCSEAGNRAHMRGTRYCEVILAKSPFTVEVYNTVGLNNCPKALWRTMSKEKIKQDNDASFVELNGPRYFMMDGFKNTSVLSKEKKSFNGMSMHLAGVLHVNMLERLYARAYQRHEVERHTTWVYNAHRPVYELIDAQGHVYVMQSYSVQYAYQTKKSLATLGNRLTLPKGWHFRTGLLKKAGEVVAVDNKAVVIQDEYKNTYQLSSRDLLE